MASSIPAIVVQFLDVVYGKNSDRRYESWKPWAISRSPACPLSSRAMISVGTSQMNSLSSGMSRAYLASALRRTRRALHAPQPWAVVPRFIVPSWRSTGLPSKSTNPFSNAASMSCRMAVTGLMPILWRGMLFSSNSRQNAGSSIIAPGAR